MLQSSSMEGYNALPTIGACVLNGSDLQLMYHTQQCIITPYDNNVDLFATSLGYIANWLNQLKKTYPNLHLKLSDEALKHQEFLCVNNLNYLKSEQLVELHDKHGKTKDVVLRLFLAVLDNAIRLHKISNDNITLYIARDLFTIFAGIGIEKNGITHNPNGNILKNWSFKVVNDLLKTHFTQSMEKKKIKEMRGIELSAISEIMSFARKNLLSQKIF